MILKRFETYYVGAICLLIATIILLPKFVVLGIVLLGIVVIVGITKKLLVFKPSFLNLLFILLYLIYLLYVLYTRDHNLAVKYLEYKLSFIVFPILFSFSSKSGVNLKTIAFVFVLSTLLLGVLGIFNSAICYLDTHITTCWMTGFFSFIHHPSYASVYFSISILCIWYLKSIRFWSKMIAIILSFIFIAFILLTLSLAGILFLLFMLTYFALRYVFKRFGKLPALITIILFPVALLSIITFEPHIKWEFIDAKEKAFDYFKNPSDFLKNRKDDYSGSNSRLILWTVTAQGINEYPLGIGTANTEEFLNYKLREIGLEELAKQNLNPHNQYLQTWLEVGVFGFLIILAIGISSIIEGVKDRNFILIFTSFALMFNMLFESILQRQSGIVFFSFALCFLMLYRKKEVRNM